jgi:hypothetical protein
MKKRYSAAQLSARDVPATVPDYRRKRARSNLSTAFANGVIALRQRPNSLWIFLFVGLGFNLIVQCRASESNGGHCYEEARSSLEKV